MLVIEDCEDTGNILFEYLFPENLHRLIRPRSSEWQEENVNVKGRWFHASDYEPSEGQLHHLAYVLQHPGLKKDYDLLDPFLYEPKKDDLAELREKLRISGTEARRQAVQQHLCYHAVTHDPKNPRQPDPKSMIIVTDLALSEEEGNELVALEAILPDGALHSRGPVPGRERLRPKLRDSTGYQLIELFGDRMPVIATTFMNNPLIHQHCLLGGACAVVPKPAPSRDPSGAGFDMRTGNGLKQNVLEDGAREGSDMLHVMVSHYATRLVAQVLAAVALMGVRYGGEGDLERCRIEDGEP